MNGVKIEVDLSELIAGTRYSGDPDDPTVEPVDLLDMVLTEVARQLLAYLREDREVYPRMRKRVAQIRDEEIRSALEPLIAEAVTRSVQPTNYLGETTGPPVTLSERVVEQATKWLSTATSDRYGKQRQTPIRQFIDDEVAKAVTRELTVALDEAKAEVVDAVRAKGAQVLTETIVKMAAIR